MTEKKAHGFLDSIGSYIGMPVKGNKPVFLNMSTDIKKTGMEQNSSLFGDLGEERAFRAGCYLKDKIQGGILGLCVADAIGVPVEFESRETLKKHPVTDMHGYGTHNQPPGTWSDDTSMTLCLLDSLASGLDYTDIMRKFLLWFEEGQYTPYGNVFDIGFATSEAIIRFSKGVPALSCGGTSEYDNGNGSLMRILPLVFYLHSKYGNDNFLTDEAVKIIHNVSALTHAHIRSQIACSMYLSVAGNLLDGMEIEDAVKTGISRAVDYYRWKSDYQWEIRRYTRLAGDNFKHIPEQEIKSSGYVIDTLEAAIWCLLNTGNYRDCVLKAVNLGEDTDTVSAVAGGLAGMYYGQVAIPQEWKYKTAQLSYVSYLCDRFYLSIKQRRITGS